MNNNEKELTGLDLEDILKEFGDDSVAEEAAPAETESGPEATVEAATQEDTVRLDDLKPVIEETAVEAPDVTSDTVRLDVPAEEAPAAQPAEEQPAAKEPAAEQPQLEVLEFIPHAPIVFNPRSRMAKCRQKIFD